jgi:hypothetical protein
MGKKQPEQRKARMKKANAETFVESETQNRTPKQPEKR